MYGSVVLSYLWNTEVVESVLLIIRSVCNTKKNNIISQNYYVVFSRRKANKICWSVIAHCQIINLHWNGPLCFPRTLFKFDELWGNNVSCGIKRLIFLIQDFDWQNETSVSILTILNLGYLREMQILVRNVLFRPWICLFPITP